MKKEIKDFDEFIVGKNYKYSEIPKGESDFRTVFEHGEEIVGRNAIHIRYHTIDSDVWLVYYNITSKGGVFKCIYNSIN